MTVVDRNLACEYFVLVGFHNRQISSSFSVGDYSGRVSFSFQPAAS